MSIISPYNQTDQYIHQMAQTIAKANRSFVPKQTDDSHTNLFFDSVGQHLLGRWIENNRGEKLLLSLNLNVFQFEWLNPLLFPIKTYPIQNKKIADLEQEIAEDLPDLGLARGNFLSPLHFTIPDYPFANENMKRIAEDSILQWSQVRSLANAACYQLLGHFQSQVEVRIWPHHFDTGVYFEPHKSIGYGFGLAMKDQLIGNPYFYFSGYGLNNSSLTYLNLPKLAHGKWVMHDHWKGAVLMLEEVIHDSSALDFFMGQVSNWFNTSIKN